MTAIITSIQGWQYTAVEKHINKLVSDQHSLSADTQSSAFTIGIRKEKKIEHLEFKIQKKKKKLCCRCLPFYCIILVCTFSIIYNSLLYASCTHLKFIYGITYNVYHHGGNMFNKLRRIQHSKFTPDDKRKGMLIVKQYTILNRWLQSLNGFFNVIE